MSFFIDSITEYATSDSRRPTSRSHNRLSSFSSLTPRDGFFSTVTTSSILLFALRVCSNSVSMVFPICLSISSSLLCLSLSILFLLSFSSGFSTFLISLSIFSRMGSSGFALGISFFIGSTGFFISFGFSTLISGISSFLGGF